MVASGNGLVAVSKMAAISSTWDDGELAAAAAAARGCGGTGRMRRYGMQVYRLDARRSQEGWWVRR